MIQNYMVIARAYYGADRAQLAGQPVRKMLAFERVYDQAAIEKASKEGTLKGLLAKSTVDELLKQSRALKAQNDQLAKDKTALQDELADLRHTRVKTKVTKLDLIVLDIVGAINAGTAYAKKHMDDADFVKEVAEKLTDINERLDNAIEGFKSALEGEGD
jgi:predicted transcriptional regulator